MAGKYANYILFNKAWKNTILKLSIEQRGELLTAMYEIASGGSYQSDDLILDMLIGTYGDEIKQNIDNYEQKCNTLKENAKQKSKCTKKANAPNGLKEGMKEGRMERRTEGLLSNPSGLERRMSADAPPAGGTPQTIDDPRDGMTEEQRNAYELKLHYDELNDMDLSEEE